jgi:hypothetical protein
LVLAFCSAIWYWLSVAQFGIGFLFGLGQFMIGIVAIGQFAFGTYVRAQLGYGKYLWTSFVEDSRAVEYFSRIWH